MYAKEFNRNNVIAFYLATNSQDTVNQSKRPQISRVGVLDYNDTDGISFI